MISRLGKELYKRLWLVPQGLRWCHQFRRAVGAAGTPAYGPNEVVVVLDHLYPSHNPGHIVRTADAFGARELHLIDMPYFNIGPTSGSLANVRLRHFPSVAASSAALEAEGYRVYALEPARSVDQVTHLHEAELPRRSAFIVGNESHGVSFRQHDLPNVQWLTIAQYGTVPCLNASVAAALALYEYVRRHGGRGRTG